jgi:CheY-like chemotaxis protein
MGEGEKKILMIDDDVEDQDLFLQAIHQIDVSITCLQPATASLALDLLLHDKFIPDYIFLDINMPVMNGFEFLKELKRHEHLARIPVIICTTSNQLEDREKAKGLGADDFLTKKLSLKELKNSLTRLLQLYSTAQIDRGQ